MRFNDPKILVERCLRISLQDLKPYLNSGGFSGTISWGENNVNISLHHDVLTLSYHFSINDGPQTKIKSTFRLERVPRHFGGFMFYMRCPKCGRGMRVIYMRDGTGSASSATTSSTPAPVRLTRTTSSARATSTPGSSGLRADGSTITSALSTVAPNGRIGLLSGCSRTSAGIISFEL